MCFCVYIYDEAPTRILITRVHVCVRGEGGGGHLGTAKVRGDSNASALLKQVLDGRHLTKISSITRGSIFAQEEP